MPLRAQTVAEQPERIEDATIQPIPDGERHGKARDLFTIWFGSNLMMLTIVTGALATTVFGQPFWAAIVAIIIGNLVGAIFMALHSAQGPQLGVPQMVQTRGQFGSYGSLLVVVLVIVMYLGFFASNLVLGGQSLATMSSHISTNDGIVIVGVVSVIAAIFGYDLIHAYTRVMSYLSAAVLLLAFIWMVAVHHLPATFLTSGHFTAAGFMSTISTGALWQIAYAPYVSDYSRYMPRNTGSRPAYWASYSGCTIGSIVPMILGAMIGLVVRNGDVVSGLTAVTRGVSVLVVIVLSVGIAATNAMNLYCGTLSTLTVGQTLRPRWRPRGRSRAVTAIVLFGAALATALLGQSNFLVNYENFISLLLYVLVPWTAVNLVDYYLVQHGDYVVDDFFRADGGRYGRANWVAIICYVLGILVQAPFVVTTLYTGPIGKALGGVDLSWIAGLVVVSPIYYFAAKRFGRQATQTAGLVAAAPGQPT
jgi:NCS1 family nucleobase:cation symporter-1